jgi:aldehyde dehydrogenase (NAD+)
MGIAKISFTGSLSAGKKVHEAAIKSNLKGCDLELGGKSATLIFDDCDIDNALLHSSQSFLANSGQVCVAGSRALVQEGIAPQFIEGLKARFQKLSYAMGDSMNPNTYLGPVADKAQFTRVMSFIEDGKKNDAPLVGGTRKGEAGNFIEPTIFLNPPRDSKIFREEIFGPVLTVSTFKTEDEAIAIANDSDYGLSGRNSHMG